MLQIEREHADLTASEVPDALGLSYSVSRAELWRMLYQQKARTEPSERLKELWAFGKAHEPVTLAAYNDVFHAKLVKYEGHFSRKTEDGKMICATPDADDEGHPVELKSVSEHGEINLKAAHVIQVVVQIWCCKAKTGRLFYYKFLTGEYACYKIRWTKEGWDTIECWLEEFLGAKEPPKRMANGEASKRTAFIISSFVEHVSSARRPDPIGQA